MLESGVCVARGRPNMTTLVIEPGGKSEALKGFLVQFSGIVLGFILEARGPRKAYFCPVFLLSAAPRKISQKLIIAPE